MKIKNLFITGTGTDVGKTYVSALLLKRLNHLGKNPAYFKAAMSGNLPDAEGNLIPGDADFIKRFSGIHQPLSEMCPYVYDTAVSPHLASRLEGNPVEMTTVVQSFDTLHQSHQYMVVEGSGGIVCPLRYDHKQILLEDVIKALNLPCLVVADAGLGTINAVVLTVEYMKSRQIPIKGIVFNRFHPDDVMELDNLQMCETLTGIKVIACVGEGDSELQIDEDALLSLFE